MVASTSDILHEYFFVFNWAMVFLAYALVKSDTTSVFGAAFHIATIYLIRSYGVFSAIDNAAMNFCLQTQTQASCVAQQQTNLTNAELRRAFDTDAEWLSYRKAVCEGKSYVRNTRLLNSYNAEDCPFSPCNAEVKQTLHEIQNEITSFSCAPEQAASQFKGAESAYYEYTSGLSAFTNVTWSGFMGILLMLLVTTFLMVRRSREMVTAAVRSVYSSYAPHSWPWPGR